MKLSSRSLGQFCFQPSLNILTAGLLINLWCTSLSYHFMVYNIIILSLYGVQHHYLITLWCTTSLSYHFMVYIIILSLYGVQHRYLITLWCTSLSYHFMVYIIILSLYGVQHHYLIILWCTTSLSYHLWCTTSLSYHFMVYNIIIVSLHNSSRYKKKSTVVQIVEQEPDDDILRARTRKTLSTDISSAVVFSSVWRIPRSTSAH